MRANQVIDDLWQLFSLNEWLWCSQKLISAVYFKVSIYPKDGIGFQCGGTIYSETLIVTSGYCCHRYFDLGLEYYEVIAGDLILSDNSGLEQRSKIKDYLIHPDYEVGHLFSQFSWSYLRKFLIQLDNLRSIGRLFWGYLDDQPLKSTILLLVWWQMIFVWYIWKLNLILV